MPDIGGLPRENRRAGSFFGRRVGKSLRAGQRDALAEALPSYLIDLSDPPIALTALFPRPPAAVRLEIGFGGGEHLLSEAERFPETGFIGVEPFQNGLAHMAAALRERAIGNVRLYGEDAALLLAWVPEGSLDRVDLLFPDPWPKRRHWKRRFVREENLALILRALTPTGRFRFASDVPAYVRWTKAAVAAHGRFHPTRPAALESTPYDGWPGTRYEAKALAAGRCPAYLEFGKAPASAEA